MTKQEIREAIDAHTDDRCLYPDKDCAWCSKEGYCASGNDAYTCLMKRLDELGVVIKVERELPEAPMPCPEPIPNDVYFYRGYERCKDDMAGYVAVELLVKSDSKSNRLTCPDCSSTLQSQGGCLICLACAWSKCG